LVIVSAVFSQWLLPATSELVLVNSTSQETVEVVDTLTVELVVARVTGDVAPVSVNVSAALSTEPLVTPQLSPEYKVNDSEPLRAVPPADEMVAESFGSQFCADVADVVSLTVKHSETRASLEFV